MTILIVDDEPECRELLVALLTPHGYRVQAADSGELALSSLEMVRPALILLDIRMPDMDGFEVCRRLKQRVEAKDIPVIFLSGGAEPAEKVEGFELGAVDFVTKPFQPDELLARVRTHLELAKLRNRLEAMVAERTAQVEESERRFRTMADAAPVKILFSGADNLCIFVNKRWLAFTGRSLQDHYGNGWTSDVHSDDIEFLDLAYTSALETRTNFEIEFRLRRADGEYRWVLARGVPLFADAALSGYITSAVDITDLKQDHERMLAAQKLESLGLMAAGVAHDFGNLLGSILAEADLALADLEPGTAARSNVEKITDVVNHAAEIVRLLIASAGSGVNSTALEQVDLGSIAEQTIRVVQGSLSKQAVVRCHIAQDLPTVRANVAQIRQVVMNLVTNASEALNGKAGTITVSIDRANASEPAVPVPAHLPPGEYVRLSVKDTGCGITDEIRSRIFDQFFTTKSTGRGLGLAAVRGIVRSHGGAINLTSEPGSGATFEVYLPVASVSERRQAAGQSAA